jgi:hypothetical protein
MITSDLIAYIKSQLNKNISKDSIISELSKVGWYIEDIQEGILSVEAEMEVQSKVETFANNSVFKNPSNNQTENKSKEDIDPYREIPIIADPSLDKTNEYDTPIINTIDKIEPMKIWAPISIKPKVVEIKEEPVAKKSEELIIANTTNLEVFSPELDRGESPLGKSIISDNPQVSVKEEDIEFLAHSNLGAYDLQSQTEQSKTISPMFEPSKIEVKPEKTPEADSFMPIINKSPFSDSHITSSLPPKKIQNIKPSVVVNSMSDIVPKSAMISSYSQDILSAKKDEEIIPTTKKNSFIKWGVIIFIVSLICGMVFAFIEGSLKIPWLNVNFSVVKKDPKIIMINIPSNISKLNSYKVDTEISISSPSLSSITTGLSSGEAVNSKDTDSISIKTKGMANQTDGKINFDYDIDLKSSILKNDINTNLKYDGTYLYMDIPDLTQVLGKNSPSETTVSSTPKQIGLIVSEFSPEVQDIIKKIDIYNILSGDVPLYVKTSLANILKEFINTLEYTEKGIENIGGVDTYHYEMTASRESTKKLLVSFVNLFTKNISDEQKKNLDEALGASSVSSFEVWIGKDDDSLYQIKFTLNAPLSRVLGLNDSGIAGNEVKLDWVTKFYDLNVTNNIEITKAQVDMEGFINKIRDIKIKNIISSFKPQANSLRNSIGTFGVRSNPSGNCINPNPGSLFSPSGHPKGADSAISSISNSMTSILTSTNGLGSCYSTSQAWALSVPLFATSESLAPSFYCADSTGNVSTILNPITGTVCK